MEVFIEKIVDADLPPVFGLDGVVTIPAAVEFHEGGGPEMLSQDFDEVQMVGLRAGMVGVRNVGCGLVVPETAAAPDI